MFGLLLGWAFAQDTTEDQIEHIEVPEEIVDSEVEESIEDHGFFDQESFMQSKMFFCQKNSFRWSLLLVYRDYSLETDRDFLRELQYKQKK